MTGEVHTALTLLLPEAQPVLDCVVRALGLDARSVPPAHMTLLFPWMPPEQVNDVVLEELREFFGEQRAVSMSLQVGWFGREVLLLVPSDPLPLVEMTRAIVGRWPQFPYYGGAYDSIDPHMTLAYGDDSTLAPVAEVVESMGPVAVEVVGAVLTQGTEMAFRVSFPLLREAGPRSASASALAWP